MAVLGKVLTTVQFNSYLKTIICGVKTGVICMWAAKITSVEANNKILGAHNFFINITA